MNISFGKKLKELRLARNLTQEKLADFLGVSFQSISKWERGDNYPDITTLPEIARFFKVSVDELLGVNEVENEEELSRKIYQYDNLFDSEKMWELINELKEKYPNDFRVLLRYMGFFVFHEISDEPDSKVLPIYEIIENNCTDDDIRICAKRYLIYYYAGQYRKSGEMKFDYINLIEKMPRMRDGQEQFCFYYPMNHPDRSKKIHECLEEHLFLFENALICSYFENENISIDFKIDIMTAFLNFLNVFYDDGNYGRMWPQTMHYYARLAQLYFKKGETSKSLENIRKCVETAVALDNLELKTVMHSNLFEGEMFDKQEVFGTAKAKEYIKPFFNDSRYPFSDEFKFSEEYKDIVCGIL